MLRWWRCTCISSTRHHEERDRRAEGRGPIRVNLGSHHRDTLERLFSHPSSANIEWRQVRSLLEVVGTVTEEPNGKVKITLGGETEVLYPPHGKDIDQQLVVDLRRMLTRAGLAPPEQR